MAVLAGQEGSVQKAGGNGEEMQNKAGHLDVRRFAAALSPRLFGTKFPGHTTRVPQVGVELATNGIQLYAIANLDKTSLCHCDVQWVVLLVMLLDVPPLALLWKCHFVFKSGLRYL